MYIVDPCLSTYLLVLILTYYMHNSKISELYYATIFLIFASDYENIYFSFFTCPIFNSLIFLLIVLAKRVVRKSQALVLANETITFP
jgi:hypothetical protein